MQLNKKAQEIEQETGLMTTLMWITIAIVIFIILMIIFRNYVLKVLR
ncbi:MAG: hypothetical protein QXG86_00360 [Candidatus Woesearchaeota archaeon]